MKLYIFLYRFLYSFALRILRGARGGIFVYRAASKKKVPRETFLQNLKIYIVFV